MYYSPPKSSIWGHSLRGMQPAVQRERIESFLSESVSKYAFSNAQIFYQPESLSPSGISDFDRYFKDLLGFAETQPGFSNLNEEQFELCFRQLLEEPTLFKPGKEGATVTCSYRITAWRVGGVSVETSSMLSVFYGGKALIIPRFEFGTMDIFESLRTSLESVGLCRLNPKHVKGAKR